MDQQPVYAGASAWIECLNETLNGLVVAAFALAFTTHMGLLYQGGTPASPQFGSFSLASVSRCCDHVPQTVRHIRSSHFGSHRRTRTSQLRLAPARGSMLASAFLGRTAPRGQDDVDLLCDTGEDSCRT
jgi:hypothetical protein